jgi:hypothetical protein
MNLINKRYTFVAHDHPIARFNSILYKPSRISNKSPQLDIMHLYVVALGLHFF